MAVTGNLKVTPEKLESTASDFKGQGSTIKGLTDSMLQIIQSLNGAWEGEAQKTYWTRFKALDGDMAQIQMKITEHVNDLTEMANNYKTAETGNTQNFSGLQSDYISN